MKTPKPPIKASEAAQLITSCASPSDWGEYFDKQDPPGSDAVDVIYDPSELTAVFGAVADEVKVELARNSPIERVIDSITIKALLQVSGTQQNNRFLLGRVLADDSPLMEDKELVASALARIGADSVPQKAGEQEGKAERTKAREQKQGKAEQKKAKSPEKKKAKADEGKSEEAKSPEKTAKGEDGRQSKSDEAKSPEKKKAKGEEVKQDKGEEAKSPEKKAEEPKSPETKHVRVEQVTSPEGKHVKTEKTPSCIKVERKKSPEPKLAARRRAPDRRLAAVLKVPDPKEQDGCPVHLKSPEPKPAARHRSPKPGDELSARLRSPDPKPSKTGVPENDDSTESFSEPCNLHEEPQVRAVARQKRTTRLGKQFRRSGSLPNFNLSLPTPEIELTPILVETPQKRRHKRNVHFIPMKGDSIPEGAQVFDIEKAERDLAEKLEERRQIALRQVEMMKELRQEYRRKRSYYAQTTKKKDEPPPRSSSAREDSGRTKRRRSQSPTPGMMSRRETSAAVRHRSPQPSLERLSSPRRNRTRS